MNAWVDEWQATPSPGPATVAEPTAPDVPAEGRRGLARAVIVSLLTAVLGGAVGASAVLVTSDSRTPSVRVAAPIAGAGAGGDLTGVAAVAAHVMPSVVRIDVTSPAGRFGGRTGTGSGVIYRSDGYILTNAHVVDGGGTVQVTLSSGEKLPARVVGTAIPSDDIAVVKVDKTNLPAATFGSIENLSVGELAVAIGSPFGLQGTVTAGVISALHRNVDLGGGERFTDAVQTDAPINPGNSGGALADANGAVIGINTAIVGSSNGNVGVGFAIPIDIARREADQIIATGTASRPFIGIAGESVPDAGGALVQEVTQGGPAALGGLRSGDVIVEMEGTAIRSMDDLVAALSKLDVGRTVVFTYVRDGARATARVTLRSRSD